MFVLRNTRCHDSEGIFLFADIAVEVYVIVMGSCLWLFLRCSFRIIFILIRCVATIAMKAFYDEGLRIRKNCFQTLLRCSAGINQLSYSVHAECSSR